LGGRLSEWGMDLFVMLGRNRDLERLKSGGKG